MSKYEVGQVIRLTECADDHLDLLVIGHIGNGVYVASFDNDVCTEVWEDEGGWEVIA